MADEDGGLAHERNGLGVGAHAGHAVQFHTAYKRAGFKDVTSYVLRHTFASRLAMAGVDPRPIQELGG
jgi:site-specific recombinase XerD